MTPMTSSDRRKLETERDVRLLTMGFELATTNTVSIKLEGYASGNTFVGNKLEIEVHGGVYPDDKILQRVFQSIFDAGVKTGRTNLQIALKDLLTPSADE